MDSNDQTKIKLSGPTIRMAQSVMNECRKAGVPIFHKWTAIDLCKMISVQLYAQQIDPVYDIEDVLNSLLYDRVVEGNTRSIQSYTSWFLQRASNHKSYANTTLSVKRSPVRFLRMTQRIKTPMICSVSRVRLLRQAQICILH